VDKYKKVKITVTVAAIFTIIAHMVWPDLKIDGITLGLLLLAIAPWFTNIIKSIEIPGVGKFELHQAIDPQAKSPGGKSEEKIKICDSQGFFTKYGLKLLVDDSGLIEPGEEARELIQIFSTEKQRTWLIATEHQMFCILDDQDTRGTGRLIQWVLDLKDVHPIKVRTSFGGNPVVDIGSRTNWLYSPTLHPDEKRLEEDITSMIQRASK
jgi:hypothetical protein